MHFINIAWYVDNMSTSHSFEQLVAVKLSLFWMKSWKSLFSSNMHGTETIAEQKHQRQRQPSEIKRLKKNLISHKSVHSILDLMVLWNFIYANGIQFTCVAPLKLFQGILVAVLLLLCPCLLQSLANVIAIIRFWFCLYRPCTRVCVCLHFFSRTYLTNWIYMYIVHVAHWIFNVLAASSPGNLS